MARHVDLAHQMLGNCGDDVGFQIGEARVLTPEGELAQEAEPRLLAVISREPHVVRRQRPRKVSSSVDHSRFMSVSDSAPLPRG